MYISTSTGVLTTTPNNSVPPYLADKIRLLSDDCNRSRLRSSDLEPRLKWAIRPFRSLVHVLGTVFLQLFGKPKPFLLSKNSWNCTWSVIPSIRYCANSEHSCEALELNEQTNNENIAINYWRQLLRIEGKGREWVKAVVPKLFRLAAPLLNPHFSKAPRVKL